MKILPFATGAGGRCTPAIEDHPGRKVLRLFADHPLVGRWVVANDGSTIEFKVAAVSRGFAVTARDSDDGEVYPIESVRWDGTALLFNLFVPSNGTRVEHRFSVRPDGALHDAFTGHYSDVLVRAPPPVRAR